MLNNKSMLDFINKIKCKTMPLICVALICV